MESRSFRTIALICALMAAAAQVHTEAQPVAEAPACVTDLEASEDVALLQTQAVPRTWILPGGSPIYNYHLAYLSTSAGDRWPQQASDEPLNDWVIVWSKAAQHDVVRSVCQSSAECFGMADVDGNCMISVRASKTQLEQFSRNTDWIEYVEPNARTREVHDDARLVEVPTQVPWGVDRIDDCSGLDNTFDGPADGGAGTHVYVIDTGLNAAHEDFGGRAIAEAEVLGTNVVVACTGAAACGHDGRGHGTHMAATIAGSFYGVAKGARIHGLKVLTDDFGMGEMFWAVLALNWVLENHQAPAVVAFGLEAEGRFRYVQEAIGKALAKEIPVVVSAGNKGDVACHFTPAFVEGAITVGASDSQDHAWMPVAASAAGGAYATNFGRCVDVFAPGDGIPTAGHQTATQAAQASGTSMASAHAAGVAAFLLHRTPTLSAAEVFDWIMNNASAMAGEPCSQSTTSRLLFLDAATS